MKRPAFQFYPADWRKDVELQSCSMAAQGLWINCMCLAHECEPYGHLTINGKAMSAAQLGRQVGLGAKECEALLAELIDAGVARKTEEGVIFSKRMVADERLRNIRAAGGKEGSEYGHLGKEHGIKGGRPRKETGDKKPPLVDAEEPPINPPPSSSSSSSSSTNTPKPPSGADVRFERFWSAYPKKVGKDAARKAFDKRKPDDGLVLVMLDAIALQANSEGWRKDGGQFIPNPATWLNQGRWQDEASGTPGSANNQFAGFI